jgi:hypothetical protein
VTLDDKIWLTGKGFAFSYSSISRASRGGMVSKTGVSERWRVYIYISPPNAAGNVPVNIRD